MLETWILLGLCLGLAIALIEIDARWRRRMTRYRQDWKDKIEKVRVEYEVILSNQDKSFNQQKRAFTEQEQRWRQRYGSLVAENLRLLLLLREEESPDA